MCWIIVPDGVTKTNDTGKIILQKNEAPKNKREKHNNEITSKARYKC